MFSQGTQADTEVSLKVSSRPNSKLIRLFQNLLKFSAGSVCLRVLPES